jgi:hypothetical protein
MVHQVGADPGQLMIIGPGLGLRLTKN